MNDDELLRTLGKAARDDRDGPRTAAEHELEGTLDDAFEANLFGALGIAEPTIAESEAPRNVIPFPPNRARGSERGRQTGRIVAGLTMTFAAAAAFVLVQRGTGERLGGYELSAQSERLERGVESAEETAIRASVGRPLTLVLRPQQRTSAIPRVEVFARFGGSDVALQANVEAAVSGSLRVTVVPTVAGEGELRVRLTPKGDANAAQVITIARPLDVRAAP
jgi:hypothetical protein